MLYVECTCPFCFNQASNVVSCLGHIKQTEEKKMGGTIKRIVSTYAVVTCCKCRELFIVFFKVFENFYNEARKSVESLERAFPLSPIEIEKTLPEPEEPPTEEVYPKKVNSFLKTIHKLFKELPFLNSEEELFGHSVTMVSTIRSVLEYSLKHLNIGNEGDSLYQRIEKAYEEGLITKVIKDWANIVRKWGNKAVHELEVSPEEALEAYEFMKFMLYFLYKVPAEVEKYRHKSVSS